MKISKREYIYNKIRNAITYNQLKPGERLIEKNLCEIYEVGRTPLREALSQLHIEGYLDFYPNKGVTIKKISPQDAENIYYILAILEGHAVERATDNLHEVNIKELRAIQNDLEKAWAVKNYKKWVDENSLFHEYFVKASGNSFLYSIVNTLRNRIYRHRLIVMNIPGSIEKYFQVHKEILDAVSRRKAKQAGKLMEQHLQLVAKETVRFLREFPEL
jgi:DNA-binding GntR family transcriptional regulator